MNKAIVPVVISIANKMLPAKIKRPGINGRRLLVDYFVALHKPYAIGMPVFFFGHWHKPACDSATGISFLL